MHVTGAHDQLNNLMFILAMLTSCLCTGYKNDVLEL